MVAAPALASSPFMNERRLIPLLGLFRACCMGITSVVAGSRIQWLCLGGPHSASLSGFPRGWFMFRNLGVSNVGVEKLRGGRGCRRGRGSRGGGGPVGGAGRCGQGGYRRDSGNGTNWSERVARPGRDAWKWALVVDGGDSSLLSARPRCATVTRAQRGRLYEPEIGSGSVSPAPPTTRRSPRPARRRGCHERSAQCRACRQSSSSS